MQGDRSSGGFLRANFESERFQHFHRSNADVRFVIPHKGVVPKNDLAAVARERRSYRGAIWSAVGASDPTPTVFANHLSKRSLA